MATTDYFLKIDGVPKGESPDSEYKGADGWIQIESWSFGASQGGTMSYGGGGGAGKVSMQDFHLVMKSNTASPSLLLACANGKHFAKATLKARKAGETPQTFLTYEFGDVLVSSFQTGGSGSSDVIPLDQISLNFATLKQEYKPQKADGSLDAPITAGWDLKQSKKM